MKTLAIVGIAFGVISFIVILGIIIAAATGAFKKSPQTTLLPGPVSTTSMPTTTKVASTTTYAPTTTNTPFTTYAPTTTSSPFTTSAPTTTSSPSTLLSGPAPISTTTPVSTPQIDTKQCLLDPYKFYYDHYEDVKAADVPAKEHYCMYKDSSEDRRYNCFDCNDNRVFGRYVKFRQTGDTLMNLHEIQVISDNVNVALGKPVTASSGGSTDPAQNLVDGNTETMFHSNTASKEWVEIDLGQTYKIDKIVVYNRSNCCQSRSTGSIIEVLNEHSKSVTWRSNPIEGKRGDIIPQDAPDDNGWLYYTATLPDKNVLGSDYIDPMETISGNNGAVSCSTYCNGAWGKALLSTKYPLYAGAVLAPGGSEAPTEPNGSCDCMLSKTVPWSA